MYGSLVVVGTGAAELTGSGGVGAEGQAFADDVGAPVVLSAAADKRCDWRDVAPGRFTAKTIVEPLSFALHTRRKGHVVLELVP